MLQPSRASPPAAPKAQSGTVGLTQAQLRTLLQHVSAAGAQDVDVDGLIAQVCQGGADLGTLLASTGQLSCSTQLPGMAALPSFRQLAALQPPRGGAGYCPQEDVQPDHGAMHAFQ